jgi:hypothetical protein
VLETGESVVRVEELVYVVKEGGGLDELTVVTTPGARDTEGEKRRDLRDRAHVRDEPVRWAQLVEDRGGLDAIGDCHPKIVGTEGAALGMPQLQPAGCGTGSAAVTATGRPPVEESRRSEPSLVIVTLPSRSVRSTRAPEAAIRSSVRGFGCP